MCLYTKFFPYFLRKTYNSVSFCGKKQKENWEPSMEKPGGVNVVLLFSVGYNRKMLIVQ